MNNIWTEKYRPKKISDCALPENLKQLFLSIVKSKEIPNMLLVGKSGMGKTTVAKALCKELNCDYMVINASDESGIDTLRNKIKNFASTVSLSGGLKVVILDEADYLNPSSFQPAFRNFTEEYSSNCRFILTANYKQRIIPELISRLSVIEFNISNKEKLEVAKTIRNRICSILVEEGIVFDKKIVSQVVVKFFPDFRKTISEIQKYYIENGEINIGILSSIQDLNISELMNSLKEKNYEKMRKWISQNNDQNPNSIIRNIFDNLEKYLEESTIPSAILVLAEYAYKNAFVADVELNMTAMCLNLMAECIFKDNV